MLLRLGEAIFGDREADASFHQGRPQRLTRAGDDYILELDLPFVSKDKVELIQKESELFIRVGPHKREMALPRVLAKRRSHGAKFENGTLRIFFSAVEDPVAVH
jgi:arsenite-transporting ATPase